MVKLRRKEKMAPNFLGHPVVQHALFNANDTKSFIYSNMPEMLSSVSDVYSLHSDLHLHHMLKLLAVSSEDTRALSCARHWSMDVKV